MKGRPPRLPASRGQRRRPLFFFAVFRAGRRALLALFRPRLAFFADFRAAFLAGRLAAFLAAFLPDFFPAFLAAGRLALFRAAFLLLLLLLFLLRFLAGLARSRLGVSTGLVTAAGVEAGGTGAGG